MHDSAMSRVFTVPEILRLICERLDKSDLARLLPVSRNFFATAMPLVWRTVSGSAPLLGLLPNVDLADTHHDLWVDVRSQWQSEITALTYSGDIFNRHFDY